MRISDWSLDVCSSDLPLPTPLGLLVGHDRPRCAARPIMLRCPSRVFFSDEPRGIAMKPVFGFPGSVVLLALPVTGSWAGQGTAASSVAAPETSAVSCSKLNVNGRKPGESLTVSEIGRAHV